MTRECEKKIAGVSDRLPPRIAETKRTITEILADVPSISNNYCSIRVAEREGVAHLPNSAQTPTDIFRFYWPNEILEQIADNTNTNARIQF
jgi:hypothetical protein